MLLESKKILLLVVGMIAFGEISFAKGLGAHVHGEVKLDIATDNNQLLVMLESPSESFLGFEHKPKTTKQKELVSSVKGMWVKGIIEYLGADELKDCKVESSKWDQKFTGDNHSTIYAEATVTCKKAMTGRTLSVKFAKQHSGIKTLNVQTLRGNGKITVDKVSKNQSLKITL